MKKTLQYFLYLILILALVSCGSGARPVDVASGVETVVAATLQSLTQVPAPTQTLGQLPRSLYFLKNDGAGLKQVHRLEKDGVTVTQLTFEPANVDDYDVSQVDGSVVYESNNQLLTINADGSNRSLIFDGGPIDDNNSFLTSVRSPVWSPDGQSIAFGYQGLNFYSIVSGQSNRVLDDQIDELDDGFKIPREMYWPESYSADGSKLVITLGYYEGASTAIYYVNGGALVRLNNDAGFFICCGSATISPDGSTLYAAYPILGGMFQAGLWRVNTTTGDVSTLITADYEDNPADLADNPYLAADGQLYYFYGNVPLGDEMMTSPPLQMVRSEPDGVTGRTVLRTEIFTQMNEALWAPDASFVIVAVPDIPEIYEGGKAQLYYTNGEKAMVSLLPYAFSMKWGP